MEQAISIFTFILVITIFIGETQCQNYGGYYNNYKGNNYGQYFNPPANLEDNAMAGSGSGQAPPVDSLSRLDTGSGMGPIITDSMPTPAPPRNSYPRPPPKPGPTWQVDDEDMTVIGSGAGGIGGYSGSGSGMGMPTSRPVVTTIVPSTHNATLYVEFSLSSYQFKESLMSSTRDRLLLDAVVEKSVLQIVARTNIPVTARVVAIRPNMHGVAVTVQINQTGTEYVHPNVLESLTAEARRGSLGRLSLLSYMALPLRQACKQNEVFCGIDDCRVGKYCDRKFDCPVTKLDEPSACPVCFGHTITQDTSNITVDESEAFSLTCRVLPTSCGVISWLQVPTDQVGNSGIPLTPEREVQPGVSTLRVPRGVTGATSAVYKCQITPSKGDIATVTIRKSASSFHEIDLPSSEFEEFMTIPCTSQTSNPEVEKRCQFDQSVIAKISEHTQPTMNTSQYLDIVHIRPSTVGVKAMIRFNMTESPEVDNPIKLALKKAYTRALDSFTPCGTSQVLCSDDKCYPGKYCNSQVNCPAGVAANDEPKSCPKCFGHRVSIAPSTNVSLYSGDPLQLACTIQPFSSCAPIRWTLRPSLSAPASPLNLPGLLTSSPSLVMIPAAGQTDAGTYTCMIDDKRKAELHVTVRLAKKIIEIGFIDYKYEAFMATQNDQRKKFDETILKNVITAFSNQGVDPLAKIEVVQIKPGANALLVAVELTQTKHREIQPQYVTWINQAVNKGTIGQLRTLTIIQFLRNVCNSSQVQCYAGACSPGKYCDGNVDCNAKYFDEPASCPACIIRAKDITVTAFVGESATLTCLPDLDCGTLSWTKQGDTRAITTSTSLMVVNSNSTSELRFSSLTTAQSGTYQCTGKFGKNVLLTLKVMPIPHLQLIPSVSSLPQQPAVPTLVWCRSNGLGRVKWQPPTGSWSKYAVATHLNNATSLLNISRPTMDNAGEYVCQLEYGTDGSKNQSIVLNTPCPDPQESLCPDASACYTNAQVCDKKANCANGWDESPQTCSCKPGVLTVDKSSLLLAQGSSDNVTCTSPDPKCLPQLVWKRKDRGSSGPNVVFSGRTLLLNNIAPAASGIYVCSIGEVNVEVNVTIEAEPLLELSVSSLRLNLTYGQNERILCRTDPTLQPQWIAHGKQFWPNGVERNKPSSAKNMEQLVFTNAAAYMRGSYECQVYWGPNKSLKKSVLLFVDVKGVDCSLKSGYKACADKTQCMPEAYFCDGSPHCRDRSDELNCPKCTSGVLVVTKPVMVIQEGSTDVVRCLAPPQCHPVEWSRVFPPNTNFSTNSRIHNDQLLLTNVNTQDSGIYRCFSGAKFASINVTVYNRIRLTLTTSSIRKMQYGTDAVLGCRSNVGQPQWRRSDGKTLISGGYVVEKFMGAGLTNLVIKRAQFSASGDYVCFIKFKPSSPEESIKLKLMVEPVQCDKLNFRSCTDGKKCYPVGNHCDGISDCDDKSDEMGCSSCNSPVVVVPPGHQIIQEGAFIQFYCFQETSCAPVWYREDNQALPTHRVITQEGALFIMDAKPEDSGNYVCRQGSGKTTVTLSVIKFDLSLNITENVLRLPRGGSGAVKCISKNNRPMWEYPNDRTVHEYGVRYGMPETDSMDLIFENIKYGANGYYTCQIYSETYSTKKVTFQLIVS